LLQWYILLRLRTPKDAFETRDDNDDDDVMKRRMRMIGEREEETRQIIHWQEALHRYGAG